MRSVDTQFGQSATADFEEMTWAFLMPDDFKIVAGKFALVDKTVYDKMKEFIEYVDSECSIGSMTADLSHDFVDGVRAMIEVLNEVKW